jgi:hypothetical protein
MDVHKDISAAAIRRDETITAILVEEFDPPSGILVAPKPDPSHMRPDPPALIIRRAGTCHTRHLRGSAHDVFTLAKR